MNRPLLYLPMDVKVREMHGKTVLAAAAAARGYKAVVGRKKEVTAWSKILGPGWFLGFGAAENFAKQFGDLRRKNYRVSIMDEEGLITFSDAIYASLRLSPATLSETDLMFAWGDAHSETVARQIENPPPLAAVGNLRFDMLRPEFQAVQSVDTAAIRKKYGRIIMIVSSFGSCNHFDGQEKYFQALKDKKMVTTPELERFYRDYFALKKSVFDEFIAALPVLAAQFPDHSIILRPHPSENFAPWKDAAEGHANIHMVHEGNVQPWILASEAIVHHFCTTAIEAFAADVPAIAYRPARRDDIETTRPYGCSLEAFDRPTLLSQLGDLVAGNRHAINARRDAVRDEYRSYVANLDGPFCITRMLDAFDAAAGSLPRPKGAGFGLTVLRHCLARMKRRLTQGDAETSGYVDHKFPPLTKAEVTKIIRDAAQAMPELAKVKVRRLDQSCFLIH